MHINKCMDTLTIIIKSVENSERDGDTRPPDLLRKLYAGQKAIVRMDMEQQTGSK